MQKSIDSAKLMEGRMSDEVRIHITPSEPREEALLDKCPEHPNASFGSGFGFAGGGFGGYSVCDECGRVFNKVIFQDDED
jgi:hypothetical protein